jgi:hypothetical protein
MNIAKSIVVKTAGAPGDVVATELINRLHPGLGLINSVGTISGLIDGQPHDEEKNKEFAGRNSALSLIPGLGGYRVGNRLRRVTEESRADGASKPYAKLVSEQVGPITSSLLPAVGGIALGHKLSDGNPITTGLSGVAAGYIVPSALGSLLAAIKAHRTKGEQTKVDSSRGQVATDYLVPGAAVYDGWKRYGRTRDWDAAAKADRKKKPNQEDSPTEPKEKEASLNIGPYPDLSKRLNEGASVLNNPLTNIAPDNMFTNTGDLVTSPATNIFTNVGELAKAPKVTGQLNTAPAPNSKGYLPYLLAALGVGGLGYGAYQMSKNRKEEED